MKSRVWFFIVLALVLALGIVPAQTVRAGGGAGCYGTVTLAAAGTFGGEPYVREYLNLIATGHGAYNTISVLIQRYDNSYPNGEEAYRGFLYVNNEGSGNLGPIGLSRGHYILLWQPQSCGAGYTHMQTFWVAGSEWDGSSLTISGTGRSCNSLMFELKNTGMNMTDFVSYYLRMAENGDPKDGLVIEAGIIRLGANKTEPLWFYNLHNSQATYILQVLQRPGHPWLKQVWSEETHLLSGQICQPTPTTAPTPTSTLYPTSAPTQTPKPTPTLSRPTFTTWYCLAARGGSGYEVVVQGSKPVSKIVADSNRTRVFPAEGGKIRVRILDLGKTKLMVYSTTGEAFSLWVGPEHPFACKN